MLVKTHRGVSCMPYGSAQKPSSRLTYAKKHGSMDPPTPLHPAPNEEVKDLPLGPVESLDLNPDLYDDDLEESDNDPTTLNSSSLQPNAAPGTGSMGAGGFLREAATRALSGSTQSDLLLTTPFETAFAATKDDFSRHSHPSTLPQQSKLINYVDTELLKVQRRFVKSQAGEIERYPILDLLHDLDQIVNLVWYLANPSNKLFGQPSYFIKILNDLEDYVVHYELVDLLRDARLHALGKLALFFAFFQGLDLKLAFFIDGYTTANGSFEMMSGTDLVRLTAVASRVRVAVITQLEGVRSSLFKELGSTGDIGTPRENSAVRDTLNTLEVEIGRLFEGVLERN